MDAEIKRKWVEALRNGKYEQAKSSLRTDKNKFCCLGVGCDIFDPTEWSPEPNRWGAFEYRGEGTIWPWSVEEAFGLTGMESDVLWNMNDADLSFAEIADYIEANL